MFFDSVLVCLMWGWPPTIVTLCALLDKFLAFSATWLRPQWQEDEELGLDVSHEEDGKVGHDFGPVLVVSSFGRPPKTGCVFDLRPVQQNHVRNPKIGTIMRGGSRSVDFGFFH